MPAHKKPAERRQRTTTADLAVAKGSIIAAPAGMTGWRPEIATAWSELWASPVAKLITRRLTCRRCAGC